MLARRNEETAYIAIPSTVRLLSCSLHLMVNLEKQSINFSYNVQHDCPLAKCTASGKQPLMQERVASGQIRAYIEHQAMERFVINMHAFHNAHLIRACLPRLLVAPIVLHTDRQAKHSEVAIDLRAAQEFKRTMTKVRAAKKKNEGIPAAEQMSKGSNKRQRLEVEEEED